MTSDQTAFEFGKQLACTAAGVEPTNLAFIEKMASTLEDQDHPNYGMLQKCMAQIGARTLEVAGDAGTLAHTLLVKAASVETWYPEMDRFVQPVINAYARWKEDVKVQQAEFDEHVKTAGMAAGVGAMLPGVAAEAAPMGIKMMLGAPALLGVGGGSLAWLLNRQSKGDTEKEQLIRARIHQYRQLADEIKAEMSQTGAPQ